MTLAHELIRKELIAETLAMLDQGGIDAVKARPLAAKVGVSVGSLYNLYGNLDGLLNEVCGVILIEFSDYMAAHAFKTFPLIEANEDFNLNQKSLEKLIALAEGYMNFIAAYEARWTAMIRFNRLRQGGKADDWYMTKQAELFERIAVLLHMTHYEKDSVELRRAARALWSSVHGIISLNFIGWREKEAFNETLILIRIMVESFVVGASKEQIK